MSDSRGMMGFCSADCFDSVAFGVTFASFSQNSRVFTSNTAHSIKLRPEGFRTFSFGTATFSNTWFETIPPWIHSQRQFVNSQMALKRKSNAEFSISSSAAAGEENKTAESKQSGRCRFWNSVNVQGNRVATWNRETVAAGSQSNRRQRLALVEA